MKKVLASCAIMWDIVFMETREDKMDHGSKVYTFPNSDAEIDVYYTIDSDGVYFDYAEVGGSTINCDMIGLQIDVSEKWDLIRKTRYLSLKQWIQLKLDHDAADLFSYHDVVIQSDSDEHYPAGLI